MSIFPPNGGEKWWWLPCLKNKKAPQRNTKLNFCHLPERFVDIPVDMFLPILSSSGGIFVHSTFALANFSLYHDAPVFNLSPKDFNKISYQRYSATLRDYFFMHIHITFITFWGFRNVPIINFPGPPNQKIKARGNWKWSIFTRYNWYTISVALQIHLSR